MASTLTVLGLCCIVLRAAGVYAAENGGEFAVQLTDDDWQATSASSVAPVSMTPPMRGSPSKKLRRDYARLDAFLDALERDIYPEPPTPMHDELINSAVRLLNNSGVLNPQTRLLDVGCGQGTSLALFTELGLSPVGLTMGAEDFAVCQQKGFHVVQADQTFMDFDPASFDFIFARHVLEHSFAPLFTLHEFKRVLAPGGLVYAEVPMPGTKAQHEQNMNHYSVLTHVAWAALFERAGFAVRHSQEIAFELATEPPTNDLYWMFVLQSITVVQ
ncbi:MAG: class I SAM-dependent methyltransferase [Methanosarcinales archaeon]|nr:MAG: class I SAM-dependent methyltransferase [Methanosarcinales archaeon]